MPIWNSDYIAMLARTSRQPAPEPTQTEQRESILHDAILADCRRRGWLAFHGSMAHRTHRTIGEPDFVILCDGGRLLLVEAKSGREKPSDEQLALHAWARKLGHDVHVVRSLAEFLEVAK